MELERIQNTGLALGAAPQTQSATSSSFGMCCIRPGNYRNARVADEHSTKTPQTSKIAFHKTPETTREKLETPEIGSC